MKKLLILLLVITPSCSYAMFKEHSHISDEIRKLEREIDHYKAHPEEIFEDVEDENLTDSERDLKNKWEDFKEAFNRWFKHLFGCFRR